VARIDEEHAFREAILDLADEPSIDNVRRYLAASRLLEQARETALEERRSAARLRAA
jgi:hypothetical protein